MSGTDGINLEKQIEIYYPSGRNLPLVFKTSLGATHLHLTQSSVLHNWCVLGGEGWLPTILYPSLWEWKSWECSLWHVCYDSQFPHLQNGNKFNVIPWCKGLNKIECWVCSCLSINTSSSCCLERRLFGIRRSGSWIHFCHWLSM